MVINALSSAKLKISHLSNYPVIIEIAVVASLVAFILIILTFIGIFYHRIAHKKMLKLSALADKEILHELNGHLLFFDSVTEIPEAEMKATVFKLTFLKNKNSVFQRSMVSLLIYFQANLIGAMDNIISSAFSRLKLREFTLIKLKSRLWYTRTDGLTEVQEMRDTHSLPEVYKLVNDKNQDVRVAAYKVLIKLKTSDCFEFLNNEKQELSQWHQIMLGDAINTTNNPALPEFKNYLTSPNRSLIILCIRLIVDYRQFNAIPWLISMLDNEDENVRNSIIIALGELNAENAEEKLVKKYFSETDKNKAAILISLSRMGNEMPKSFVNEIG